MKKLIIAAVAIGAAVCAQAASFDWTTSAKAYGPDITALKEGHMASGTATAQYMKTLGSSVAWTYVMTLTDAAGSEDVSGAVSSTNYSSNKIKMTGLSSDKIYNPATDEAPACDVAYSIVITGKYTDTDGVEWTMVSDAITGSATFGKLSELKITSDAPSGWNVTKAGGDVPEPTSGLLLLLGMAGLALRRKNS